MKKDNRKEYIIYWTNSEREGTHIIKSKTLEGVKKAFIRLYGNGFIISNIEQVQDDG